MTEVSETMPADCMDGIDSCDDEDAAEIWGRLWPLGSSFNSFDLQTDEYTFGRGEMCHYQFNTEEMRKHPCFPAYSKIHFKLSREQTSTGVHIFLTDSSSNGTFVNGEKVGKGNKQVICNNDEIALALKTNRAFVFMDSNDTDEKNYPEELREKYTMSKLLGRGACGEVKLAFEKGSCRKFAVKVISKKKFSVGGKTQTNIASQVQSEVKILQQVTHPCIIGIEGVINTVDTLYIVLELVEGGELFDRVVSCGQFSEPLSKLYFYQMLLAIKYLHDKGITHRDLKVTDFGLSKLVDGATMMKTFCGTPNYLAPEILKTAGNSAYTKAIDVWSLGVILYICLVGYPPFNDERKDMDLPKQIMGGHYEFHEEYWKKISKQAKDLISKMMTVDPNKRITLTEVLQHPWLKDDEMKTKAENLMNKQNNIKTPNTPTKRKCDFEENGTPQIHKKMSVE